MTEKEQKTNQETKTVKKNRVTPQYGIYTEDDKVILQVAIPGANRESIRMKALNDYFTLRADRGESVEYTLDLDFGVKIEPEKTTSSYDEGLLRIEFKRYNPLEHAYLVPIQ